MEFVPEHRALTRNVVFVKHRTLLKKIWSGGRKKAVPIHVPGRAMLERSDFRCRRLPPHALSAQEWKKKSQKLLREANGDLYGNRTRVTIHPPR